LQAIGQGWSIVISRTTVVGSLCGSQQRTAGSWRKSPLYTHRPSRGFERHSLASTVGFRQLESR